MVDNESVTPPRVFISYSWTSQSHQDWVVALAERLVSDGVDVVLDLWELREGQDKYAFMERMVTDPSISKVLAICDRSYAEKADAREKGVGTESQIISKEIYDRVDQKKFVAIVTEYFDDGEPCLPTFFKSRKYIDTSSEEKLQTNYEQLLRFIFDKPLHQKPRVGQRPSFLVENSRLASPTASKLSLLRQAILADRSTVPALIAEYLRSYSDALENYRITNKITDNFDEKVFASITQFVSYRDEFIEFVELVAGHRDDERSYQELHEFFQAVLAYLHPPAGITSWNDIQYDNFRFILFVLFLYTITVLIKKRRFGEANLLLEQGYFDENEARYGRAALRRYSIFDQYPHTLEEDRKRRLELRFHSVTAQIVKEQASYQGIRFDDLVETDLILYLRGILHSPGETWGHDYWRPRTAPYTEYRGVLSLFAKASAHRVFEGIRILLGVENKDDLKSRLESARERGEVPGRSPFSYYNIETLINLDGLDTSK
jgi:TIR domain